MTKINIKFTTDIGRRINTTEEEWSSIRMAVNMMVILKKVCEMGWE